MGREEVGRDLELEDEAKAIHAARRHHDLPLEPRRVVHPHVERQLFVDVQELVVIVVRHGFEKKMRARQKMRRWARECESPERNARSQAMKVRTATVVLLGALVGGGCATTGDGSAAAVEQAAINDAEQIGVAALASRLGVSQGAVGGGLSLAKSVYNGGGRTAQAKEVAVRQGADKVLANAKAEGKSFTAAQSSDLEAGLRDLLK
jgi:hypothetical protein